MSLLGTGRQLHKILGSIAAGMASPLDSTRAHTSVMIRLLFAFLMAASLHATPFPHVLYWGYNCPRTMVAGSRTFCMMSPGAGFTFTVNASTDVFTADSNYTPRNGDTLTPDLNAVSTLPSGMKGITAFFTPVYVVCNVSSQTYQLREGSFGGFVAPQPCTGRLLDVTDGGTGTLTAYLQTSNIYYLDFDPTGYPVGTTFAYMRPSGTKECNTTAPTSGGKVYAYNAGSGASLCIIPTIPSNATPGTYTTHTVWCSTPNSTNCTTFDWDIEVVAPPNISYTPPSSFTAIPGRAQWEGVMIARPCPGSSCGDNKVPPTPSTISGPANYCNPLSSPSPVNTLGAATSSTVSFYGWNLLFDNMAIYTGNSVYRTGCFADGMGHVDVGADLRSVRDYVTTNGGRMISYAHFTESLFRACRVFSDPSYCTVGLLMQNNLVPGLGPFQNPGAIRPMAYGLDDIVALKKYGNLTVAKWADVRDGLYSLVQRVTESTASGVRYNVQQYQLGLAAHAIIADWQLSGDARAPWAVKRIADLIWEDYDQTNHVMMNLEGPDGSPWCSNTLYSWFMNDNDGGCGLHSLAWQRLQMHAVNAFWWYYAYTGDTTYRDRGDDIFRHVWDNVQGTGIGGPSGKDNSEMYYNSFNAVGWRDGTLKVDQWYGDAQTAQSTASCDLNAMATSTCSTYN